jgi:hypothetical protein
MSDNGQALGHPMTVSSQWEVLERIEAEGDNYIDPFYEDDDASVLNDNNNAPAANIPANKQRQLLENFRTYSDHAHNSILSHLPTISDPVSS